jgi:glycosyltransferase involved in cell wall biosynthesis
VFITSRNAALLDAPVRARRRYLWIHDALPWHSDRLAPNYEKLDAIFCLSPWHRDYLMRELRIGPEKLMITRNGIDPERFPANIRRRKHRFIYSSSLDRGLDTLLEIFPRIRTELPDAELHVYYGFDHWEKMLAVTRSQESLAYIQRLKTQLSQPGVFYHGRIGQKQLAEEMVRSDVWLYPTRWSEGYCITALEAMAAGVLCICTDLGALTTTVGSRGILLKGDAYSEEYRREAVETTLSLLRNRRKRNAITARAREWARQQTWSALAREWTGLFGTEVGDYRSPAAV